MGILKRIYNKSWNSRREMYLRRKRKRLKNHDFSILSNNCVGGIISHDLHERFNSPTVNLWFTPDDFLIFVEDLDFFLNADLIEAYEEGINYPIGRIYYQDGFITVYFMHYKSFEEAVEKWKDRSKRIQKNNLFVVFEYPAVDDTIEKQEEVFRGFERIPYKKIMLTKPSKIEGPDIVRLSIYNDTFFPGKILKWKNRLSVKRYLDDYDYVSFINNAKPNNSK